MQRRSQYLSGRLGYPLGNFFKVSLIGDFAWNAYDDSSEAQWRSCDENAANGQRTLLRAPLDHQVYAGTVQFEFNRIGYSITASGTALAALPVGALGACSTTRPRRSSIRRSIRDRRSFAIVEADGLQGVVPAEVPEAEGGDRLPGRQRISTVSASTGFGRFGDESLDGFAGTGVRFDTGAIARTGWAFNIANVVRFDVSVEFARVRDRLQDDRFARPHGAGLSFNVMGPWMTIWQGSYGRAISSDVPELEGKQEFSLILKFFPRGLKRKRSR